MKYREERGLPVIVCTNLNLDDIKKKYGSTFYSMIDQSLKLEMRGNDKRKDVFKHRRGVAILLGEEE
jgi:hypothetical protein